MNGTYFGTITGSGMVEKLGTGTVIFTGANSYTGGTSVLGARCKAPPPVCRVTSSITQPSCSTRPPTVPMPATCRALGRSCCKAAAPSR
ncbi:MAG: autotransporter-associated beta strand repeat-containing protein [Alphaproteobacteria bacterium]|nr:autotransporter-associated beta strand repeat-containing protein [Alphaproteobacteria bacterium]